MNELEAWVELRNFAWNGYAMISDSLYEANKMAPDEPVLRSVSADLWRLADSLRQWDKAPFQASERLSR